MEVDVKLAEFVRWVVQESCWSGTSLDGGSVQDKALECGIILETQYDPAAHGENDVDAQPGDQWFVFTDAFKRAKP